MYSQDIIELATTAAAAGLTATIALTIITLARVWGRHNTHHSQKGE